MLGLLFNNIQFTNQDPPIWVKGFGGVGESYVMKELKHAGYITNDGRNKDRIKHSAFGIQGKKPKDACPIDNAAMGIYVYGDPMSAVESLYRRGYRKYNGK